LVRSSASKTAVAAAIAGNGDGIRNRQIWQAYPGNKGAAGVFQTIINQIPPHECFVEAFAGSGQILRHLRPAASRIVIDADAAVVDAWKNVPGITTIHADARSWLSKANLAHGTVVYCDPPYLREVRSSRKLYAHEFDTEAQHEGLLTVLKKLTVPVLLSGYPSSLYARMLSDWRRVDYTAQTHGGPRAESLWCNFPEPFELHDYRYLGEDYREREQIKRMKTRWKNRLLSMPRLKRLAMLNAVAELKP
jgi:hypothetical protein